LNSSLQPESSSLIFRCLHARCEAGHSLEIFSTPEPGYTCEGCSRIFDEKSVMWGCRLCDIDLCAHCQVGGPLATLSQETNPEGKEGCHDEESELKKSETRSEAAKGVRCKRRSHGEKSKLNMTKKARVMKSVNAA